MYDRVIEALAKKKKKKKKIKSDWNPTYENPSPTTCTNVWYIPNILGSHPILSQLSCVPPKPPQAGAWNIAPVIRQWRRRWTLGGSALTRKGHGQMGRLKTVAFAEREPLDFYAGGAASSAFHRTFVTSIFQHAPQRGRCTIACKRLLTEGITVNFR